MKKISAVVVAVSVGLTVAISKPLEVDVQLDKRNPPLAYGVDAKLTAKWWAESDQADALIHKLFVDEPFSLFRLPFYAMRQANDPLHLRVAELALKAKKANPDTLIFASVANGDGDQDNNLHRMHKFPLSMRDSETDSDSENRRIYNLNLDAYAKFLDAYILEFREHGVAIDWLGPFNEDNAPPEDVAYLYDRMEIEEGYLRVGVETWSLGIGIRDVDGLEPLADIVGSHFYDDAQGEVIPRTEWTDSWRKLKASTEKPVWFTEATDYKEKGDKIEFLVNGLERLIPAANGGVDGIVFYQTVPRLIGYDGKVVDRKYSGLMHFARETCAAQRISTTEVPNDRVWVLGHLRGEESVAFHIANSSNRARKLKLKFPFGYELGIDTNTLEWSKYRTKERVKGLVSRRSNQLVVKAPAMSYLFVSTELKQAPEVSVVSE